MLIKIDGKNSYENITSDRYPVISSGGSDSRCIYMYSDDEAIKLLKSSYMTEINVDYLKETIKSRRLLKPLRKGLSEDNSLVAYTTAYIESNPLGLSEMSSISFLESLRELEEIVNDELSSNKIAAYDLGSGNYLVGKDGIIYILDFDKYRTIHSPIHLLSPIKGNYERYNEKQFSDLIYQMIENELLREANYGMTYLIRKYREESEKEYQHGMDFIKKKVLRYKKVKDYAKDTIDKELS